MDEIRREAERSKKLLRMAAVERSVSLSRAHIYALIKRGQFPAPVKIGYSSLWVETEIDSWIDTHIAARDNVQAA